MKNKLFFLTVLSLFSLSVSGQNERFTGTWEGTLQAGVDLKIVFHIAKDGKVKADSPDQSAFGLPCSDAIINQNEIRFEITEVKASYTGKLVNDSTMEGIFTQGVDLPLTLKKKGNPGLRKRPQTPLPPFPYSTEEVIYPNADSTLRFGATLSIPAGKGPFPAVVLITGSGPQNRDEEILGHKFFMVLADHLTRNGILVLRADDRGVGKSTGNFSKATSEDFAKDISTHVDYLLTRNEVNKKWIGLIGHSEGGMIAPMVAAARKDIAFLVLMAGPGVKCMDLLVEQNVAIARTAGTSEAAMDGLRTLFRKMATAVLATADMKTAFASASAIADDWAAQTDSSIQQSLGVETKKKRDQYVRSLVLEFQTPWFRYFLQFDPAPWLQKIKCPVLAINGEKDIQVISGQNLPGMKAALKKSKSKNYEVKELPGLNHLFQTCTACNTGEYGELEETLSPLALNSISEWLGRIIPK